MRNNQVTPEKSVGSGNCRVTVNLDQGWNERHTAEDCWLNCPKFISHVQPWVSSSLSGILGVAYMLPSKIQLWAPTWVELDLLTVLCTLSHCTKRPLLYKFWPCFSRSKAVPKLCQGEVLPHCGKWYTQFCLITDCVSDIWEPRTWLHWPSHRTETLPVIHMHTLPFHGICINRWCHSIVFYIIMLLRPYCPQRPLISHLPWTLETSFSPHATLQIQGPLFN